VRRVAVFGGFAAPFLEGAGGRAEAGAAAGDGDCDERAGGGRAHAQVLGDLFVLTLIFERRGAGGRSLSPAPQAHWARVRVLPAPPAPRFAHSLTALGQGRLLLLGGACADPQRCAAALLENFENVENHDRLGAGAGKGEREGAGAGAGETDDSFEDEERAPRFRFGGAAGWAAGSGGRERERESDGGGGGGALPRESAEAHAERVADPSKTAPVEVIINLVDVNDPPVVNPNLVLYADQQGLGGPGFLGLNSPLATNLGTAVRLLDEDQNPSFLAPALTTTFGYISYADYGSLPPSHPCKAADPTKYPMATLGDLFRVDLNGDVTPVGAPGVPFNLDTPLSSFGVLAVATYELCITTTDSSNTLSPNPCPPGPMNPLCSYSLVPLAVRADLADDLWLSTCSVNASAPLPLVTSGGTTVTCTRGDPGLPFSGALTASYGIATGGQQFRFTTAPCSQVDSETITCLTVPGVGTNLVWSFATGTGKGIGIKTPFLTS
jgi:hypothetical protein